jgi:hypothetical protein
MIESQVRDLFAGIASGEPGSSRVDTGLAHRQGRARLRWRRAGMAGAPVAAAAAVAAVVLAVGAAAPPGPSPLSGPTAPRQFNVLDPYLSFGWLPAGLSPVEGGTSRQLVWLDARHTFNSAPGWSVGLYAAGQCHVTGQKLKCRAPHATTELITGRAPDVAGHRAFWAGRYKPGDLVWQYARDGWAYLSLPGAYASTRLALYRREAIRVASQVRYGAATPPLLFPFQLTDLPSRWQVSSLAYVPDAGVLLASQLALGAGPPNLGADGGLIYETGLPYFFFEPATRVTETCGRGTTEIINGYPVVLNHRAEGTLINQSLCAGKADGLSLSISQFGAHPAISAADLFGHHMRLLGRNPAHWTPNPIG